MAEQGVEDELDWTYIVRQHGLGGIQELMYTAINIPMLEAFLERWQPETNSFHMPWGEMTITLHDVHFILGLKITGHHMGHSERDKRLGSARSVTHVLVERAKKMFKIPGRDVSQARVPVQYFIQHVQSLNLKDADLAGAYIMYLLASTLFPDKSQSKLPLSYVQFVEGIDDDAFDISWGSGALAFMYRSLGECTRSGCKQASFCYTLLEVRVTVKFLSNCAKTLIVTQFFNVCTGMDISTLPELSAGR